MQLTKRHGPSVKFGAMMMPDLQKEILPPYVIRIGQVDSPDHFVGGSHSIAGAFCRNCQKPLPLYVSLDLKDDRLKPLQIDLERLPLLYCMRCEACWYDFSYRVSIAGIELLEFYQGTPDEAQWRTSRNSDFYPKTPFSLVPLPRLVQVTWDKLNSNQSLTPIEEAEVERALHNQETGPTPIVEPVSQLGGRGFLIQRLDDPFCPACNERMRFLLTLYSERNRQFDFADYGTQIVWFLCRSCMVVKVQHSI